MPGALEHLSVEPQAGYQTDELFEVETSAVVPELPTCVELSQEHSELCPSSESSVIAPEMYSTAFVSSSTCERSSPFAIDVVRTCETVSSIAEVMEFTLQPESGQTTLMEKANAKERISDASIRETDRCLLDDPNATEVVLYWSKDTEHSLTLSSCGWSGWLSLEKRHCQEFR